MIATLHDRLGYEIHRTPLKVPPSDVIIWGELAYVRQRQYEDPKKPHEKYYRECSTQIVKDTPASGVYRRSDLDGPT